MLRVLVAAVFGVLVGGVGLSVVVGDPTYTFVWTMTLPVFIILLMLAAGVRVARTSGAADHLTRATKVDVDRAGVEGRLALARVESINRTSVSPDDRPLWRLELVVAPTDVDAYRTTTTAMIDLADTSRYQRGEHIVVARARTGAAPVALVPEPTVHQRGGQQDPSRIPPSSAVSEVPAPDGSTSGTPAPTARRGLPLRLALYVVVVILAAGAVIAPSCESFARGVTGIVTGQDPYAFGDGVGIELAVEALIEETGDTMFTGLTFHNGYATADAPTTPGAVTTDSFEYRYGRAARLGPESIQPDDIRLELFDVREYDLAAMPGLVSEARRLTGMGEDSEIYLLFIREISVHGQPGATKISLYLKDDYYDASVHARPDGTVYDMDGGQPGSESWEAGQGGN